MQDMDRDFVTGQVCVCVCVRGGELGEARVGGGGGGMGVRQTHTYIKTTKKGGARRQITSRLAAGERPAWRQAYCTLTLYPIQRDGDRGEGISHLLTLPFHK